MRRSSLVLIVWLCACGGAEEPAARAVLESPHPVVATVNGQPIVADGLRATGFLRSEEERRGWVRAEIARRLGAEEAIRRGLLDEPQVQHRVAAIRRSAEDRERAYLRDVLFEAVRDDLVIPESELRAHYAASKGRYYERQLTFRRLAFDTREGAEAASAALGAAGRLDAERAETIGPAPIQGLPRDILPEALGLGESGDRVLVESRGSWALVELVEVQEAVPRAFEEVRARVVKSLRAVRAREAFQELQQQLLANAEVSIDDAVIRDDAVWEEATARRERRRGAR